METSNKMILIVEDDTALRSVLADKLTEENFLPLQAADGEEGLKIALEKHPALILLDIYMPKMDGITMLSKLRSTDAWGKHVAIIVLTNSTDAQTIEKISSFEGTEFLVKNEWSLDAIIGRIRERIDA